MNITANLIVPKIEACLPFWVDRLGFVKTVEVPDGDGLGFVILMKGDTQLMLQSEASLAGDVTSAPRDGYRSFLYVTVPSLVAVQKQLADYPKLVEERTTFYGARETIVRDPAGNVVAFSEHVEQADATKV